ncbi:MAG: mono/diheme cytochrome c family protein [Myxococcota bacterium]
MKRAFLSIWVLGVLGCGGGSDVGEPADLGEPAHFAYLEDGAFRRGVLVEALWAEELPYARGLLGSYALPKGGWDRLPVGAELSLDLDLDTAPTSAAEWIALGRRVFFEMPMRADGWVAWLVAHPEIWDAVGLPRNADGAPRGIVSYDDANGVGRAAVTCAACHSGDGLVGRGDRGFDIGEARALFAEARGVDVGPMRTWGPGRIDVADDGVNGPTAIPDLFGVKHAQYLNYSGSIGLDGGRAAALAVRFETQFILGHRMEARPDRRLTWALAQFVLSLEAPVGPGAFDQVAADGAEVFATRCAGCHQSERGYSGGLVDAAALTSDPTVANTPERGTGFYKVPALLGVGHAAPYLHDGSAPDLDALLSSGHPSGQSIPTDQRVALVAFLNTL